jgi:hypothetical protein
MALGRLNILVRSRPTQWYQILTRNEHFTVAVDLDVIQSVTYRGFNKVSDGVKTKRGTDPSLLCPPVLRNRLLGVP